MKKTWKVLVSMLLVATIIVPVSISVPLIFKNKNLYNNQVKKNNENIQKYNLKIKEKDKQLQNKIKAYLKIKKDLQEKTNKYLDVKKNYDHTKSITLKYMVLSLREPTSNGTRQKEELVKTAFQNFKWKQYDNMDNKKIKEYFKKIGMTSKLESLFFWHSQKGLLWIYYPLLKEIVEYIVEDNEKSDIQRIVSYDYDNKTFPITQTRMEDNTWIFENGSWKIKS